MYDKDFFEIDLLEMSNIMELFPQEVVNEMSIAGMKITKENLQDEDFVKELVKKIKRQKEKEPGKIINNIALVMSLISLISMLTIVGIPIGLLLLLLSSELLSANTKTNEKDLSKLDDCMQKNYK